MLAPWQVDTLQHALTREGDPMLPFARSILVCLALALGSMGIVPAADVSNPRRDALDGLQFQGETGEQGKGEHHEDTIAFKGGLFRSLDCETWGFGPAPYRVEKVGESYRFSATLVSPDRGRLEWQGTVTGDSANASFRWLHERWYWNIDRRYWFKGTRYVGR